jgi:hypothetical protein
MTSINKDKITNHAAAMSISFSFSFFIAVFGCSFAHGQQQEDHTTSITAFGKFPTSTPRLIFTSLSQPIPPTTNNIGQQQEQIIGSDLVVPSPSLSPSPNLSLPMDRERNDRQRLQSQEEQTSETQLTAQEEQSQLLTDGGSLKDPRAQSKLMEEEKEKAELEIKQRLDDIGAGEEDDREASNRGGAGDDGNNREDTSGDTTDDNEAPLDLKLPVPFP